MGKIFLEISCNYKFRFINVPKLVTDYTKYHATEPSSHLSSKDVPISIIQFLS